MFRQREAGVNASRLYRRFYRYKAWHIFCESRYGERDITCGISHRDPARRWMLEDLPANRVRILTQEAQNGTPAKGLAITRPNPMLNGHQEWLDGLIDAARKSR